MDAIFGNDAEDTAPVRDLLEKISKTFLFGKVANILKTRDRFYEEAPSVTTLEKLEMFLQVIQERRDKYVRAHGLARDTVFSEWQMRDIHNKWMADHNNCMNEQKIKEY